MGMEIPEMPSQKHQEAPSFEEMDNSAAEPKKIFRRLAYVIRPDLAENHEASVRLNAAYEKSQAGDNSDLMEMYLERFPDGIITPELDEFEKEQLKREEIFEIIKSELNEIDKLVKKKKNTPGNPLKEYRSGFTQRYESMCKERGIKPNSDYAYMKYDADYLRRYIHGGI